MSATNTTSSTSDNQVPEKAGQRARSKIGFPYFGLEECVGIARIVHGTYGGRCDLDQLAASLNQTPNSGGFRLKVSAARLFGLVNSASGTVTVTDLGSEAIDGNRGAGARVAAFLNAPLYSALCQRFRGRSLPGDSGIEAAIRDLGVSPKQVTTARQAFLRSATFAGFFAHGRDRLVMPPAGNVELDGSTDHESSEADPPPAPKARSVMTHPLIVGLLGALPEPGEDFSEDDRELWLDAAKVNLQLIYGKPNARSRKSEESQPSGQAKATLGAVYKGSEVAP